MARRRARAVEIDGMRELRRKLEQFDTGINDLKSVHMNAARIVEPVAQALVPRRPGSGRLAGTIRTSGTKTGARIKAGFARVPYAGVIHFGWPARNIRPQPFLYDAVDRRRSEVFDAYEDALDALMDRYQL